MLIHHYRLLSTILNTAVQWNVLLNNPAERTKLPRVEQKETQSLDGDEITVMLQLLEDVPPQVSGRCLYRRIWWLTSR